MDICNQLASGILICALVLSVSCSRESETPSGDNPDELVRMGDCSITVQDLEAEQGLLRNEGHPVPSQKELLQRLVEFKAQALKARSMGVGEDPAVQRQIEKLLIAAMRKKEKILEAQVVADEDIKAVYDESISKYTHPALDRFAILYLQLEKSASSSKRAEVCERMKDALKQAQAQKPSDRARPSEQGFDKLSATHSDDLVSRYRGGDSGWSNRNAPSTRVPKEVWEAGIALDKGEISEILERPNGFYLIKKTDFRAENITPFEKVRVAIRKNILQQRRQKAEKDFVQACLTWAAPVTNEDRIAVLSVASESITDVVNKDVRLMGVPGE